MTKDQLKAQIVQLIESTPVFNTETLQQLHALTAEPKTAKSATKPKQSNTDRETVKALKEQIATLKAQIQPNQSKELDREKLLDDLFQLQLKRQQEIINNGSDVTIGLSAASFKCLNKSDGETVYFLAGTNIAASQHIKSNGSLIGIVTSVAQESGRLKCSLFVPNSSSQVFTKSQTATGHNLKPTGTNEPCKVSGSTITFYSKQFVAGTILNVSGSLVEVVGTRTDGNLVVHSVKAYEMKQQAVQGANTHYVDTLDVNRNYSIYHSQVL